MFLEAIAAKNSLRLVVCHHFEAVTWLTLSLMNWYINIHSGSHCRASPEIVIIRDS